MRTKFSKRAKRSSEKKSTSVFIIIDPSTIMKGFRDTKVILYDCMQPRVLIERMSWTSKNEDEAIISELSSPSSSQDGAIFHGFSSKEDSFNRKSAAEKKPAITEAKATSANNNVVSEMTASVPFQMYFKGLEARFAKKYEQKDAAYDFNCDENDSALTHDDHQSLITDDGEVASSGHTLTATDSEFCSLSDSTDAIDEYSYVCIESGEASDMNVGQTVDVNAVNMDECDTASGDEFYDAEEGEIQEEIDQDEIFQEEHRGTSMGSALSGMTADVDEDELRIDYDSNDSWNSNDKIGDCHIIADDIDDFDDENLLICKEKMEDSNSQDGFNDELENRETFENGRRIVTDILDLIESNRSVNRTESGKRIESIHLFCNVCIRNLIDGCYDIHCQFSHILPPSHIVLDNLESANLAEVDEAYHELLLQYPKLFEEYFQAFCIFYAKNKIRTQLRDMSLVCVKSEKGETFMQEIVNGFVSTGMPYSTSVEVLIKYMASNGQMIMDTQYKMLVLKVALNQNNAKLLDHLHHFEHIFIDGNCAGRKDAIEKLLKINLDSYVEAITKYTLDVLKKCTIAMFLQTNQTLLKAFLETARMYGHLEAKDIMHRMAAASIAI